MNLISLSVCLWCLFFTAGSVYTQSCDYIRNLRVFYKDTASGDNWKEKTLNECIDEVSFKDIDVTEIHVQCNNPHLTKIGPNFVKNLETLQKIQISECKIEIIESGAFINLPKVMEILIFQNPLKEIRKFAFEGLSAVHTIHLHNNEISYIDDHAFANLHKLRFIDINHNQCEFMRKQWFTNTTGLVTFFMVNNKIRQIPARMFEGWRSLEWFNLNGNDISVIHDGAFNDIAPIIKNLDLHLNRLTTISLASFSTNNVHIEILRLSANLFNYIPDEFVKGISVDYLYIHGNPFKCPCLERLHWVLHEKRDVIVDFPKDPYFYQPCYSATAPVCVESSKIRYCQDTVDSEVTRTYLTYLRKIGYDNVKSGEYPCAMLGALDR